jgi:hypothetical protein
MLDKITTQKHLLGNLNANVQISSYCSAIANTTIAKQVQPGTWYAPFVKNLGVAQKHATSYLTEIGPDCWSTVPTYIQNYGQRHNNAMGDVQKILDKAGDNDLTDKQIKTIVELLMALQESLKKYLGDKNDSNLATKANPKPTPTIYGCHNDIVSFDNDMISDNKNLIEGKNGAAVEVGLKVIDETTMTTAIGTLNGEISTWNTDVELSEIGIGASIFVAAVGIALAPETGGLSLVATGIGVAGLGGSIAGTVVYSNKVKDNQNQIAIDQARKTTDKQQVNALNGIIISMSKLSDKNKKAQIALGGILGLYSGLITEVGVTLSDLKEADSGKTKGIMEKLNIQNVMSDWGDLVKLAQNILGMTTHPQTLKPPAPIV